MTHQISPEHLQMHIEGSGIALDVAQERRYRTSTGLSELKSLGILIPKTVDATGLLLPLWSVGGSPAIHWLPKEQRDVPYTVYRPNTPWISPKGQERKYLNPKGAAPRLDCHLRCHDLVRDPQTFLWITEGQKKGDALVTHGACVLDLLGVDSWRCPMDWPDVELKHRDVGIVFDSDVMTKPPVQRALASLTEYLTHKGAAVQHVYLPSPTGEKVGVDDYLLTHLLADLEALLAPPRTGSEARRPVRLGWQADLLTTKSGMPMESFGNLKRCVANNSAALTLWYDLVRDRAMVGDAPLTDAYVERAALAIEHNVAMPIRKLDLVRKALVAQCRERERDPLKEWLEMLPPWDRQPRLLTWLPAYTGAAAMAYTRETGRLWLVSMVARGLEPGCQCRSVIVLLGAEDIGKSKLVKVLASEAWYRDISGSLEGKEAHMLMKGTWLVEMGELSSMSKTEENRLKSFITMVNDEYVPKYANDPIKQARRTILVGTLNPEGDKTFLRGQTGSTRYYPVPVTTINLEAVEALREQLFAEALAYYQDHRSDWWKLTPEADKEAREMREDYRVRSVYEESLGVWLNGRTTTHWQEICEHFLLLEAKERWKDTKLQKDIAQAMVACGWHQDKQQRVGTYGRVRPWVPHT